MTMPVSGVETGNECDASLAFVEWNTIDMRGYTHHGRGRPWYEKSLHLEVPRHFDVGEAEVVEAFVQAG